MTTRIAGTAFVLTAGLLLGATPASGQEGVAGLVAEPIARAWGVSSAQVVLEDAQALPGTADSVQVAEAANGRWLVTFWIDGGAVRRFQRAGLEARVPVAARPVARGAVVQTDDVAFESRVVWADESIPPDPIGLVAQRRIAEGSLLRDPAVRPPYLVVGGQEIEAVLSRAGVVMTVAGEALGSARQGDVLLVRLASGLRTEARAISPGRVELIAGGN